MRADAVIAVYIMANFRNGTIYTGVTSDLMQRIWQHRTGATPGFASEHGCKTLVWYEQHETMIAAIVREKALEKWRRSWKLALIESANSQWLDLAADWYGARS